MSFNQLQDALQSVNLSKLARASGLTVRTLRRIKNGAVSVALSTTIERVQPHLRAARRK